MRTVTWISGLVGSAALGVTAAYLRNSPYLTNTSSETKFSGIFSGTLSNQSSESPNPNKLKRRRVSYVTYQGSQYPYGARENGEKWSLEILSQESSPQPTDSDRDAIQRAIKSRLEESIGAPISINDTSVLAVSKTVHASTLQNVSNQNTFYHKEQVQKNPE